MIPFLSSSTFRRGRDAVLFACCIGFGAIYANARDIYVNDASTAGDVFTTAVGSDSNAGTAAAPYANLSKALSVAVDGDRIIVDSGTYNGGGSLNKNLIINKAVEIIGAGAYKTVFDNNYNGSGIFFAKITASNVKLINIGVVKFNNATSGEGKAIDIAGNISGVVLNGVRTEMNGTSSAGNSGGEAAIVIRNGADATIKNGSSSCNLSIGDYGGGINVIGAGSVLILIT